MKRVIIFSCTLLAATTLLSQQTELTKIWESDKVFRVPESILFSKENACLFVSNIDGKPTEKDGAGYISKVSIDGKISEEKFIDGLNAPKGMGIYKKYALRDGY